MGIAKSCLHTQKFNTNMLVEQKNPSVTLSTSMLDLITVRSKLAWPACHAVAAVIDRYLPPVPDLSSKPASHCCRSDGTDSAIL